MEGIRRVSNGLRSFLSLNPDDKEATLARTQIEIQTDPTASKRNISPRPSLDRALRQCSQSPKTKTEQWLHNPPPLKTRSALPRASRRQGKLEPKILSTASARVQKSTWSSIKGHGLLTKLSRYLPAITVRKPPVKQTPEHSQTPPSLETDSHGAASIGSGDPETPSTPLTPSYGAEVDVTLTPDPSAPPNPFRISPAFHPTETTIMNALHHLLTIPNLPSHWRTSYSTYPDSVFTTTPPDSSVPDPAPLRAYHSSFTADFRAQRAFSSLTYLGGEVRSQMESYFHPEGLIVDTLYAYLGWAAWDGGWRFKTGAPGLAVIVAPNAVTQDLLGLQELLSRKLRGLAEKWRQALRIRPDPTDLPSEQDYEQSGEQYEQYKMDPPLLVGFLVHRSRVGIVTFSALGLYAQKSLAVVDYSNSGHDVWNGIIVARVLAAQREMLFQAAQLGWLGEDIVYAEDVEDL